MAKFAFSLPRHHQISFQYCSFSMLCFFFSFLLFSSHVHSAISAREHLEDFARLKSNAFEKGKVKFRSEATSPILSLTFTISLAALYAAFGPSYQSTSETAKITLFADEGFTHLNMKLEAPSTSGFVSMDTNEKFVYFQNGDTCVSVETVSMTKEEVEKILLKLTESSNLLTRQFSSIAEGSQLTDLIDQKTCVVSSGIGNDSPDQIKDLSSAAHLLSSFIFHFKDQLKKRVVELTSNLKMELDRLVVYFVFICFSVLWYASGLKDYSKLKEETLKEIREGTYKRDGVFGRKPSQYSISSIGSDSSDFGDSNKETLRDGSTNDPVKEFPQVRMPKP